MKLLEKILPHFIYILSIMFIVFFILDKFNPLMQFVNNNISSYLLLIFCIISLVFSIISIIKNSKK